MLYLVILIVVASLVIGGGALVFLYQSALNSEKSRLAAVAHSQARLIDAVAQFDARFSQHDHPAGWEGATLSQIRDAYTNYEGFGQTGALLIARRRGGNIEFHVFSLSGESARPTPVPWDSKLAEPARRALSGEAGTIVDLDYRGVTVVAAYEPLRPLNAAIVAKIDLTEVTAPFYRVTSMSVGALLLIVLLGALLYRRIDAQTVALEKTEAALRRSEASLNNAQRIAGLGNWDWDIVGGGLHWSDEIYRIFGLTPRRFGATYKAFLNSVHPEDRQKVEDGVRAALYEGAHYSVEHRIVRPDGEIRTVHEVGEITFDEAGAPVRMTGTVLDVTERARAASEIRALNERLEQRVEERTAELHKAQAELVRQERLATLGRLAATVSHELRNPLGAIGTSLAVVDAKVRNGGHDVETALDRMRRSISRCDRIIGEMLDYARERDLFAVPTEIDTWLAEVIDEQEVPPGIDIDCRLGARDAVVRIDPEIFRRAIINLYNNACDALAEQNGHTPAAGTGRLTIATAPGDGCVEISLADTGPGMSEAILDSAFEPLFSTKGFGVGLGLPIVRKIVEQHQGSIRIDSREGDGTRVTLTVPQTPPRKAGAAPPA